MTMTKNSSRNWNVVPYKANCRFFSLSLCLFLWLLLNLKRVTWVGNWVSFAGSRQSQFRKRTNNSNADEERNCETDISPRSTGAALNWPCRICNLQGGLSQNNRNNYNNENNNNNEKNSGNNNNNDESDTSSKSSLNVTKADNASYVWTTKRYLGQGLYGYISADALH